MQLDDLREQLREFSERVPDGSVAVGEVFVRTRRTVRRGRIVRGISALVLLALVGTLAVVLNASRPSPRVRVNVAGPPPKTTVSEHPVVPFTFTEAQLRAHDGVGVTDGWAPVDEGDARVWVPSDWTVEPRESCYGGIQGGLISLGRLANAYCQPGNDYPIPAEVVSLVPSTRSRRGTPNRIVHGYRVYLTLPKCICLWDAIYDVPQLGLQIVSRGDLATRILDTLAPSARKVALAFAAQTPETGYRPVAEEGVQLSIPSGWAVTTPSSMGCGWLGSYPGHTSALAIIRPDLTAPSCPFIFKTAATAAHEGAYLYTSSTSYAPQPRPHPVIVLRHGDTTISVSAEKGRDPNVLELFVRRAGSSTTHALLLGLGRDGRVAGRVLASIRATS